MVLDSGASRHINNNEDFLHGKVKFDEVVKGGEGTITKIKVMGTLRATVVENGNTVKIFATYVAFVAGLSSNLLSVISLRRKGLTMVFGN